MHVPLRTSTDRDPGRIVLGGFSHGAQLTYAYAAADGRHISAIAALDIYYDIAPEDADLQAQACANAAAGREALAQGVTDFSNSLFITAGQLVRNSPEETSPLFPNYTNRGVVLTLSGLTPRRRTSPCARPRSSMRSGAARLRGPNSPIRIPLFYLGAAGGFGDHGLYSTTRVSSTDVTRLVVRRFGPDRVAEDFGHGDLLYAEDAPTLAWGPLAAWLRHH